MALLLGITAMMMTPALAADYEFDAPDGGMYAPPTSVDQVIVVGGGVTESSNIDRSKNTAIHSRRLLAARNPTSPELVRF